jgi:hypothetical protein
VFICKKLQVVLCPQTSILATLRNSFQLARMGFEIGSYRTQRLPWDQRDVEQVRIYTLKLTPREYDLACCETLLSFHKMEAAAGRCEPIEVTMDCGATLTVPLPPLFTTGLQLNDDESDSGLEDGGSEDEIHDDPGDESSGADSVEHSSEDDESESFGEESSTESELADETEERTFAPFHQFINRFLWYSDRDIDTVLTDTPSAPRLMYHASVVEKLSDARMNIDHAQRYLAMIQPRTTW